MVLGSFYFQLTNNGNLLGEYMNNKSTRVTTESADFIGEFHDSFIGDYQTTWFDGTGQNMLLSIRLKNENRNIFRLDWRIGNIIHFVGEGFLSNDQLIGTYWDNGLMVI